MSLLPSVWGVRREDVKARVPESSGGFVTDVCWLLLAGGQNTVGSLSCGLPHSMAAESPENKTQRVEVSQCSLRSHFCHTGPFEVRERGEGAPVRRRRPPLENLGKLFPPGGRGRTGAESQDGDKLGEGHFPRE